MNKQNDLCKKLYNIYKKCRSYNTIKYNAYKVNGLSPYHFVNMEESPDYVFTSISYNNDLFLSAEYDEANICTIVALNDHNSCPQYALYCLNLCILSIIYKNGKLYKL